MYNLLCVVYVLLIGCADGFFNSQSSSSTVMCVRCPVNSNSMRASDIECTCTDGAFNEQTGGMTTTNADCSGEFYCILFSFFYRLPFYLSFQKT